MQHLTVEKKGFPLVWERKVGRNDGLHREHLRPALKTLHMVMKYSSKLYHAFSVKEEHQGHVVVESGPRILSSNLWLASQLLPLDNS